MFFLNSDIISPFPRQITKLTTNTKFQLATSTSAPTSNPIPNPNPNSNPNPSQSHLIITIPMDCQLLSVVAKHFIINIPFIVRGVRLRVCKWVCDGWVICWVLLKTRSYHLIVARLSQNRQTKWPVWFHVAVEKWSKWLQKTIKQIKTKTKPTLYCECVKAWKSKKTRF